MIFNTQAEYNKFYDKLKGYTTSRLSRYNIAFKDDACDKAMDRVVNWLLTNPQVENPETFAKRIIINSIKNSIRDRKVEPISESEYQIGSAYQIITKPRRGRPRKSF